MKKLWLVGLIIAALVVPAIGFSAEAAAPTLKAGAKIKWLYTYQAQDDSALGYGGNAVENFSTTNVELDISGTAGDKVSYLIEISGANGLAGNSNAGELGAVGVRQAKIMVDGVIPMTTVTLGTFNLPVGTYQPRGTNDYDLIGLPLINSTAFTGSIPLGWGQYAPTGLGWQATGADFTVKAGDNIVLDIAYFNGYAGLNTANAELGGDLEKSFLVNLKVKVAQPATLAVAYLSEGWQEPLTRPTPRTAYRSAAGYVISGSYINDKVEANFDWMTMTAPEYAVNAKGKPADLTWTGYQITAGYWVTEKIEALVRYEWIDPNTENSSKLDRRAYGLAPTGNWTTPTNVNTNSDQLTWLTLGVNARLSQSSEVSVNYIWRMEQGDDIKTGNGAVGLKKDKVPNPALAAPGAGEGNPKYQVLSNDLFLIQVQLWQ